MALRLEIIFSKEKRSISFKSLQVLLRSDLFSKWARRLLLHGMAKFTIQRGFFSVWELLSGTNYRRVHCVLSPKTARPKPRFAAPKGHIVFCCLLWKKEHLFFLLLKKLVCHYFITTTCYIYSEYFFCFYIFLSGGEEERKLQQFPAKRGTEEYKHKKLTNCYHYECYWELRSGISKLQGVGFRVK